MADEPWREYEKEVTEHFTGLAEDAVVTSDEVFIGRKSRAPRKVEIVVRGTFPGFGVATMLVDCKLWKKRVGVRQVGEFHAQVDDIGAELGVLVTSAGVTKSAMRLAAGYRGIKIVVQKYSESRQEWEPDIFMCSCEYGYVWLETPHRDVLGVGRCDRCSTLWAVCSCGARVDFDDGRSDDEWWECDGACGREWLVRPGDPRDGSDDVVWYRDNGGTEYEVLSGPDADY